MLVVMLTSLCLLDACICLGPGLDIKHVMNFDSPIYTFGDMSHEYIDCSGVCVERYNESTSIMRGVVKFLQKMSEKAILQVCLLKEASGKFEMLYTLDMEFCKELGDEGSAYKKFLKFFGIPTECPIEPGAYNINDFSLDTEDMDINSKHAGRYEAQMHIFEQTGDDFQNDRELKCTLKIDMLIEPEE